MRGELDSHYHEICKTATQVDALISNVSVAATPQSELNLFTLVIVVEKKCLTQLKKRNKALVVKIPIR